MQVASRKPAEADMSRLGALSRLPVFFDLTGKRVIVAGGGAGAAWKAELLAASGARVDVVAPEFSDEMQALFVRGEAAGELMPHARIWFRRVVRIRTRRRFPGARRTRTFWRCAATSTSSSPRLPVARACRCSLSSMPISPTIHATWQPPVSGGRERPGGR